MKAITILVLLIVSVNGTMAQTWEEFTSQKRVQTRYLVFQLTALKAHGERIGKGYSIAKEGLAKIAQSTGDEYALHEKYFTSLKTVNAKVRNHKKVLEIRNLHQQIIGYEREINRLLSASGAFTATELEYLRRVYAKVRKDCDYLADLLDALTTDYQISMSDAERLQGIDALHKQMQGNYTFCKHFGNEAKALALSRTKQKNEVEQSRALHGIHP